MNTFGDIFGIYLLYFFSAWLRGPRPSENGSRFSHTSVSLKSQSRIHISRASHENWTPVADSVQAVVPSLAC